MSIASRDRFASFARKHYGAGTCKFCEYDYRGYHQYMTHLQQDHPDKWHEFEVWSGLKPAGDER